MGLVSRIFERQMSDMESKELNRRMCSENELWTDYFTSAENDIDREWNEMIWPMIKDFDFDTVLELAPGRGRNTSKLAEISGTIHAVDLNQYALDQLSARFKTHTGPCKIHIHKNNGSDLSMIADQSITAIYCWDAAVHFDKEIVRDYVKEFARVLKPGGCGFIHHSDLGDRAKSNFRKNPGWRSNLDRHLFKQYCEENGLEIIQQLDQPWIKTLDCKSAFRKPTSA